MAPPTGEPGTTARRAGDGRWAEVGRKLIHVAVSVVAAGVVWRLEPVAAATVLAAATLIALAVELLRRTSTGFARWFHARVGGMLRAAETHRLTGATTLSVGYTLAVVVFPPTAAVLGILVTGIADALAAVVGKRFGRHRYPGGKSVEGSVAFLLAAFAIAWGVSGLGPLAALATAALVTLLEAPSLPVDDNLYLPILVAAAATGISALLAAQGFS